LNLIALQVAASMGHQDVLKVLLQKGANVNARHKFAGSTALHFAVEMGQVSSALLVRLRLRLRLRVKAG